MRFKYSFASFLLACMLAETACGLARGPASESGSRSPAIVIGFVQVDSVSKNRRNDSVIPANVEQAVNFYQPHGLVRGESQIRPVDPSRTRIVGNFRFDYRAHPISCASYRWWDRFFVKPHTEIECDPNVWSRVESLICSNLPPLARAS